MSFEWKEEKQKKFEDLKEKPLSAPMLKFPNFTKLFEVHTNANEFNINEVFMQDGHPITFQSKKLCGKQLQWPIHEKELYIVMCYLKLWQHYLGMHKTKVFMDNVSLRYFETELKASMKQLRWHNTLGLLDVKLIHKLSWDNVVPNVMNKKKEFQADKPSTNRDTKGHLSRESSLKRRIKEAYMQGSPTQHHFK